MHSMREGHVDSLHRIRLQAKHAAALKTIIITIIRW